jgi:hypothetical protein
MKALKFFVAAFTVCFAMGLVIAAVSPTPSLAEEDPCNRNCYFDFECAGPGTCPPGQTSIRRCYQPAGLFDCEGPFNCGCYQIGCTYNC